MDYFAHAAYGVLLSLEEEEALKIDELIETADGQEDEDDDLEDQVAGRRADEIETLRKKYGAGPGADLHYTGDEDDRPGRCATAADSWVLGYGVLGFPDIAAELTAEFKSHAEWHFWVTCG
jgi:hypothetical protein